MRHPVREAEVQNQHPPLLKVLKDLQNQQKMFIVCCDKKGWTVIGCKRDSFNFRNDRFIQCAHGFLLRKTHFQPFVWNFNLRFFRFRLTLELRKISVIDCRQLFCDDTSGENRVTS